MSCKFSFSICIILLFAHITASAQVQLLRQQKLKKWGIPAGNYSGIAPLGGNRYAIVDDKAANDGWTEWIIEQDSITGQVTRVQQLQTNATGYAPRDAEGIAFVREQNAVYISAEDDQRIIKYDISAGRKATELQVPSEFSTDKIYPNYGFEALTFADETALFWTCTENSLRADGPLAGNSSGSPAQLRLQSFGTNLMPLRQYTYTTDAPKLKSSFAQLAFGVPALTALADGKLLILEREFLVTPSKMGSYVANKIYLFSPESGTKTLQTEWTTRLNLTRRNLANYEGMCLGRRLADGRQTILLISDSQGGYGNSIYRMKDYLRVAIL